MSAVAGIDVFMIADSTASGTLRQPNSVAFREYPRTMAKSHGKSLLLKNLRWNFAARARALRACEMLRGKLFRIEATEYG